MPIIAADGYMLVFQALKTCGILAEDDNWLGFFSQYPLYLCISCQFHLPSPKSIARGLTDQRFNSVVYHTTPTNGVGMLIVTPGFVDISGHYNNATTYNQTASEAAWKWRSEQNLTGREASSSLRVPLISQAIDGKNAFRFAFPSIRGGDYKLNFPDRISLSPLDCLNVYSDPWGNRSDIIVIADFDYLSKQDTVVANASNSLLFEKFVTTILTLDFAGDYQWLCGNTNSFDCKSQESRLVLMLETAHTKT